MDLNLTQGQCFTKCYSLLSLISFNLDALIKAECSEMKSYAKLIITDFNILIDVLMQIKILESQRTQKSVLETALPYIGEFFHIQARKRDKETLFELKIKGIWRRIL